MDNMVDFWLYRGSKFIPKKIQSGTKDITHEAAMTTSECYAAGAGIVEREFYAGCNIVALSDMGMGTLESARVVNAALLDRPLIRFLPASLKNTPLSRRLQRALNRHPATVDPIMNLTLFGGYELAMLTGAVLQAAQRSMTILLDGCVALTALHLAAVMHPEVAHYALIAQQSSEPVYKIISEKYRLKTVMHAGIEKRDGVGAALAFPLLRHATSLL
jgi:nicotinate-nucleotide--dimethylbenzimidazole phosphoribosyltransferase